MRIALLLCLALAGCNQIEPQSVEPTSNGNIKVDVLFEHEGCRVYRFRDEGKSVYYVRCANASWTQGSHAETESDGQGGVTTTTVDDAPVQTVYGAFPLPEKNGK